MYQHYRPAMGLPAIEKFAHPFLRFIVPDNDGGGAGDGDDPDEENPKGEEKPKDEDPQEEEDEEPEDGKTDEERGFPLNTPPSEMTAEQQAAYWRVRSRRNERRKRTAEQELKEEKRKHLSASERAMQDKMETARREGESIGAEKYQRIAVTEAVRAELARNRVGEDDDSDIQSFVGALDFQALLTDEGAVDHKKINAILKPFLGANHQQLDPYSPRRLRGNEGHPGSVDSYKQNYLKKYKKEGRE